MEIDVRLKINVADDGSDTAELVAAEKHNMQDSGLAEMLMTYMDIGDVVDFEVSLNGVRVCKSGEAIHVD